MIERLEFVTCSIVYSGHESGKIVFLTISGLYNRAPSQSITVNSSAEKVLIFGLENNYR